MRFGIAYGADAVYMAGQRFGNLIDVYLNLVVAALHKIDLRLRPSMTRHCAAASLKRTHTA